MILTHLFVFLIAFSASEAERAQPLECQPCSCNYTILTMNVACDSVDITELNWKRLPPLETIATFRNLTNFGFHQFPALSRNITTYVSVTDVVIEDLDLSGFYVIRKLRITGAMILNPYDVYTVQKSLRDLEISDTNLSNFVLNPENNIESLDLSKNQLGIIPNANQASTLVLHNNKIENLLTTQCQPMTKLTILDLSRNHLTDLPENAFHCILATASASVPKVTLKLSENAIRSIHPRAFVNTGIEKLDLSRNMLRAIDSSSLDWKNLGYLNLQNNPWNCICEHQWMMDELIPHLYKSHRDSLYDLRCGSPKDKLNRPMAYWLNHTGQVFCQSFQPSSGNESLFNGVEAMSFQEWAVLVIGLIITVLLIVLVVLVIIRTRRRQKKRLEKRRSSANYSLITESQK